jgi:hypothetical protein
MKTESDYWIEIAESFDQGIPINGICWELDTLFRNNREHPINKLMEERLDTYIKKQYPHKVGSWIFPTKLDLDFKSEYNQKRAEICRLLAKDAQQASQPQGKE